MPRRLEGLDGLRGLAALAIVALHVWMYTGNRWRPWAPEVQHAVADLRLGLVLFFVLTAFLLIAPWVRAVLDDRPLPPVGAFARRRLLRILPGYWVAMAGAALVLAGTAHPLAGDPADWWKYAAVLQNHFGDAAGRVDPPAWSLGVELVFSALVPLLGLAFVAAGRRHGRAGMLAVCGAAAAAGCSFNALVWTLRWPDTVSASVPTYLPVFACGLAAAVLVHGRTPGAAVRRALWASGVALVALDAWWHHESTGFVGHVLLDAPAAAGFAMVLGAVVTHAPPVLALRPLAALGTISYGVYLWHVPVLLWLATRGALPTDPEAAFVRTLLPTLVLATLSWLLVERPAIALSRGARTGAAARPEEAEARQEREGRGGLDLRRGLLAVLRPPAGRGTGGPPSG